jgi:hypothetical protein
MTRIWKGIEPLGGNRCAAVLTDPECPFIDPPKGCQRFVEKIFLIFEQGCVQLLQVGLCSHIFQMHGNFGKSPACLLACRA